MIDHDTGDEDRRATIGPTCDVCAGPLKRYEARRVPLCAVDGGVETATVCAEPACAETAFAMYRSSTRRKPGLWLLDETDAAARQLCREAAR